MSEIDIKTYVRARGRVKGSITKIENFVNSIENEVVDYEKVNMRFKQLDVLLAEFVKYDDIVGGIEGHDYEFYEIEAKVIKLKDKLLDIQKELCDDKNSKQMNVAKSEEVSGIGEAELSKVLSMLSENQKQLIVSTTENQNVVSASLPKINIKSFNGEYCEWPTFKDNFTKLIHENRRLSKIEKFVQLKNFLGPKPLLLIQNLIVTNENYDSAWQKLNKRYDNGRKIANSYLDLFFNQKIVRDGTAEEIRCISDTTESILNGLDSLGDNVQNRDIWLIYILLMKLDDKTKQLWAEKQTIIFGDNNLTQINSSFSTIAEFLKFLDERRSALETIQDQEYNKKSLRNNKISTHFIHNSVFSCNICKSNHPIYKCSKFQTLNSQERKDYVIKNKLCFNCLSNGHSVKTCKSYKRCLSCNGKHHTSIHLKKLNIANDEIQDKTNQTFIPRFPTSNNICSPSQQSNDSSNQKVFSCNVTNLNTTILPTAQVLATHSNGYIYSRCNVLLDSGSQVTFISEALAQQLKLKREQIKLTVAGLSSTGSVHTNGVTKLKLRSLHNKEEITIRAHILKNIASRVPETTIDVSKWPCLSKLKLADEQFGVSKKIDILLGADYFFNVLKEGQIEERHHPCLKNTIFGWVVVGTYNRETAEAQTFTVTVEDNKDIENSLERFWKLESVVETTQTSQMSHFCETHFEENTITDKEGKFVVALPFVEGMSELGDSMDIAISKFYSLERRLQNNTELYEQYREFLKEYEQLGHMQQITANEIRVDSKKSYYFPHHAVERPEKTTTKVRVVFNGSSKTKNGISLNQILAVGPTVQRDIQTILINFRWHKIVLVGDIEKMYRQVLVRESDCNYQRIVWRDNPDLPLRHYKLCTVTYGTTCAPFLATRCLMEVGIKNQELFPIAAKAIINDFYVDDFISGADDIQKALELQKQVTHLLAERNFKLRKWKSNSVNILRQISHNIKTELIDLNGTSKHCNSTKVLGLHWDSEEDFFTYRVNLDSNFKITKRNILSESSKIFDPLGFISPCTIAIKIIFQQLWIKKVDWDEDLPLDIQNQWKKLRQQFKKFEDIKIQRWIQTPNSEIELIGFCDASEAAYSAVIYIKTTSNNKISNVKLLTAKSKVAPLKRLTIPRLELCGASLLTKLYSFVCSSLQLSNVNMTAFTDSSVVLSWLNSQPNQWKPYVANRVSNIIEILPGHKWKHVSTNSNPADCASRGISVDKLLEHTLWWHGPSWLTKEASEWPFSSGNTNKDQAEKELRKNVLQTFYYQNTNDTLNFLFDKISSITKILRIISYCLRITGKWKLQTAHTPFLQSDELEHSLRICIAWAQENNFHKEIDAIRKNKPIPKFSCLRNLRPFLDKDGLLRVLGRIQNSQTSYNAKHPYILPKNDQLAVLIIRSLHKQHLHAGATLLTNILKSKYWIIGCRYMVKKEIYSCVACVRQRGLTQTQLMAALPEQRVIPSKPFLRTGLDYAGPFNIKQHNGRNAKQVNAYLAVFVCLSTKAAHLELVSSMTSECFIAALRRFIGRRGLPAELLSDNGSNFVGAKRQLQHLYEAAFEDTKIVADFCATNNISWKMIPPGAPHMGGLWESCVKSAKAHLKRIIGTHLLTFEEMSTLFIQIEAQLNSRPLTPLYESDIDNIDVLTPGHFLISSPLVAIPEPYPANEKLCLRDRWHLVNKMQHDFWKQWHRDYLNILQGRKKWQTEQENVKVGDIILVKDNNLPATNWGIGKIEKVFFGTDGLARVALIKTSKGVLKRPITKLVKLPVHHDG